jgi:hypothetical protein
LSNFAAVGKFPDNRSSANFFLALPRIVNVSGDIDQDFFDRASSEVELAAATGSRRGSAEEPAPDRHPVQGQPWRTATCPGRPLRTGIATVAHMLSLVKGHAATGEIHAASRTVPDGRCVK